MCLCGAVRWSLAVLGPGKGMVDVLRFRENQLGEMLGAVAIVWVFQAFSDLVHLLLGSPLGEEYLGGTVANVTKG